MALEAPALLLMGQPAVADGPVHRVLVHPGLLGILLDGEVLGFGVSHCYLCWCGDSSAYGEYRNTVALCQCLKAIK